MEEKNKYLSTYNSSMITSLMTVKSNEPIKKGFKIGSFTYELIGASACGTFKTSTRKLIDFCLSKLYENGSGLTVVSINEYAELCGRSGTRKTLELMRQSLIEDFNFLTSLRISWKKKSKKETFGTCVIFQSCKFKRGKIYIRFSEDAVNAFKGNPKMELSAGLMKLDGRNRLDYIIGRTFDERRSNKKNRENGTSDIISVKTLLKRCKFNLVTLDGNRYAKQRIIEPIEAALNNLFDVYAWEYCNAKKAPLREDQKPHSFNEFQTLYIHFEHR